MHLLLKIISGMAISADPDQTAPTSDLGLHSLPIPFLDVYYIENFHCSQSYAQQKS